VSSPSVCEHCAAGCALRTDHRRGKVMRRLAGDDPEVNEEWNCDKGRFAFAYTGLADRLTHPLVRDEATGELRPASWPEALAVAGRGLAALGGRVGVLAGGRLTVEDSYAYAKFARTVLGTNDIDFRARAHSGEEADFLAATVAGSGLGVTYADLEKARTVVLAGFEPEDESPIVFLRLRKAQRQSAGGAGTRVFSVSSHTTRGLTKLDGRLVAAAPGDEAGAIAKLYDDPRIRLTGDDVILVGERLAASTGALSAAARLAELTGAKLAWVPRRAGERGAVDTCCLPNLLPGGRPVDDATARAEVAAVWNADVLPSIAGRDTEGILEAVRAGALRGLVVGGVEPGDLPDPEAAVAAVDQAEFVVSLELRASEVTERADVVFPVAAVAERSGSFTDWEGRLRPFDTVLKDASAIPDLRVLAGIAEEMGSSLGFRTVDAARAELAALGAWDGERSPAPEMQPLGPATVGPDGAILSTWRQLLDDGRLQEGDPYLAATARTPVARLSPGAMRSLGLTDGDEVVLRTDAGAVALPAQASDLPDGVVWAPQNSAGLPLLRLLNAGEGDVVRLEKGAPPA
jgi:NADH-quinone oxidoreductase subunit G